MNLHSAPNFLAAILILAMGLFATLRNRGSKINFSLFLLTLAASIWQFGTGLVLQAKDPFFAIAAARITMVGVYLIPVTSYHLSLYISGINKNKILIFGYLSALLFFIPLGSTTSLILNGLYKYPWGFYFKAGLLHPVFMVFFISYMLLVLFNLFLSYKKETRPIEKNRKKYFFVALFIAYIGTLDYLPAYGIGIYPFGYLAVICCFLIFVYAIQRYNLMDARVVITRAAIFIVIYIVVLTVPFIFGLSLRTYLLGLVGIHWWLIPVCLMGLLV